MRNPKGHALRLGQPLETTYWHTLQKLEKIAGVVAFSSLGANNDNKHMHERRETISSSPNLTTTKSNYKHWAQQELHWATG